VVSKGGDVARMSDLGDRFREYAALCDEHLGFVAAGMIARPNETIVTAFTESKDCGEKDVAIALYHGVMEPPIRLDSPAFRELRRGGGY
jgi:hypothetical protein